LLILDKKKGCGGMEWGGGGKWRRLNEKELVKRGKGRGGREERKGRGGREDG
jgi:hypothetical protein